MPASGLLAVLDDVATMTKIAAKKTAGIAGDDLAVNSQVVTGLDPKRELPIIWEITKGSLKNKFLYIIPAAIGLSVFAPWAVTPLMMLGGAYLAYEGIEKLMHGKKHDEHADTQQQDPKEVEKKKISQAIKTDFILSAEIIVVSLGAVAAAPLLTQIGVLGVIGLGMTAGIYGLVGGLVKLDDIGLHMQKKKGDGLFDKAVRGIGKGIVQTVPWLMKGISVLGTAAMFAVGGGILLHGIPAAHHAVQALAHMAPHAAVPFVEMAAGIATGLAAGLAAVPTVKLLEKPAKAVSNLFQKMKEKVFGKNKAPDKTGTEPAPVASPAPANTHEPEAEALKNLPDLKTAHKAAAERPVAEKTAETQEIQSVIRDSKKRHAAP